MEFFRKTILLLIFSSFMSVGWGQDCLDGIEVELWGECYNIEETTELNLSGNDLTGVIPPDVGNLDPGLPNFVVPGSKNLSNGGLLRQGNLTLLTDPFSYPAHCQEMTKTTRNSPQFPPSPLLLLLLSNLLLLVSATCCSKSTYIFSVLEPADGLFQVKN